MDITALGIGDVLHMRDVQLPEGVTSEEEPDAVVLSITAKVEVAEPEPVSEGEEGEAPPEGEEAEKDQEKKDDDKGDA